MVIPKRYPVIRLVFLGLLVVVDTIMTYVLISEGFAKDLNPLINLFIAWGWEYFFLIKILISLGFVLFVLYVAYKKEKRAGLYATLALIFYAVWMVVLRTWDIIALS